MEHAPVFNPAGNDDVGTRTIWFGNTTNLKQLNDIRYGWARQLYKQMREQFWIPQKLDITGDVNDYASLTAGERRAFDGILSYLTFLDSVQTCNIPHLGLTITAPEVSLCLNEQTSQEAMHNESYQVIIDTIVPSDRRSDIYEFWRTDKVLYDRCKYIAGLYQQYVDNPSQENYFIALVADYMLEGLYFYNGFAFFYNLASSSLMSGCADIFRLINRDELSHVRLYQKLLEEARQVFPHSLEQIYEMFDGAVQQEVLWASHIIGDSVLGITEDSTEHYTRYLANTRLKAIGLSPLYSDPKYKKSPYAHLERFADVSSEGSTKSNFFEGTVTSYVMSSGVEGWEDF